MLTIPNVFSLLLILGQIFICSATDGRFKPKKECLEKYGVPATRSPIYSEFMDTKYRCAIKCTSPTELTRFDYLGLNQTEFTTLCLSVENTTVNNMHQQMCLHKYNTTIEKPSEHIPVPLIKYVCGKSCMLPILIGKNPPLDRSKQIKFAQMCLALKNSEHERMCFNKFNLTSEKRSTAIVTVKHHCVMSCIAPNVIEIFPQMGGLNQTLIRNVCPSLENTPENNEKQQMCFNKYNASIEIVHKDSEIERGQFFCALSCISTDPLKAHLHVQSIHQPIEKMLDKICPSLENTTENNEKQRACFEKYDAPMSKSNINDRATFNKYNCALKCIFPQVPNIPAETGVRSVNCSAYEAAITTTTIPTEVPTPSTTTVVAATATPTIQSLPTSNP